MDDLSEIKQSKTKIIKLFIGSIVFVAMSMWIISFSSDYAQPKAALMVTAGILGIIFFAVIGVLTLLKLFYSRPGVVFTSEGFIDNTSYAGGFLIKWSDVKDIKVTQVMNQKFASVILNNPEDYLARMSGLKKFVAMRNYKSYQTPVHISANSFQLDFEMVHRAFIEKWYDYKENAKVIGY